MTTEEAEALRDLLGKADAILWRLHREVDHLNTAEEIAYATAVSAYVSAAVALDPVEQQCEGQG